MISPCDVKKIRSQSRKKILKKFKIYMKAENLGNKVNSMKSWEIKAISRLNFLDKALSFSRNENLAYFLIKNIRQNFILCSNCPYFALIITYGKQKWLRKTNISIHATFEKYRGWYSQYFILTKNFCQRNIFFITPVFPVKIHLHTIMYHFSTPDSHKNFTI